MSNNNTKAAQNTFPLVSILTIIFVIAKLTGYITWTWWWVFSPIWISLATTISLLLIFALVIGIAALAIWIKDNK